MTHPSVPYYRIDPHDLGRPENPHPPASLTVRERIRLHDHTEEEIEVAKAALRLFRKAENVPKKAQGGGTEPKYTGKTAKAYIAERVECWRRQIQVENLMFTMAREEDGGQR